MTIRVKQELNTERCLKDGSIYSDFLKIRRDSMKNLKRLFVVLILSAFAFGACDGGSGDSGGGDSRSGGVILPLALGNIWTHSWIAGAVSSSTTTSVSAIQNIAGEDTYRTGTATLYNYYRNHDDGLYDYGNNLEIYASQRLYLKYPCSVGDTWSYDGGTLEVMSTSAPVDSDAGTFNCIEYYFYKNNSDGTFSEHMEYWFPGVGQVLQYIYLDHTLVLTVELKNYTLN
jgi:hypothetical protein